MRIRCKLISPTNVLLSRPLLNPLDEEEWFFVGVKSHKNEMVSMFGMGVLVGMVIAAVIISLAGTH